MLYNKVKILTVLLAATTCANAWNYLGAYAPSFQSSDEYNAREWGSYYGDGSWNDNNDGASLGGIGAYGNLNWDDGLNQNWNPDSNLGQNWNYNYDIGENLNFYNDQDQNLNSYINIGQNWNANNGQGQNWNSYDNLRPNWNANNGHGQNWNSYDNLRPNWNANNDQGQNSNTNNGKTPNWENWVNDVSNWLNKCSSNVNKITIITDFVNVQTGGSCIGGCTFQPNELLSAIEYQNYTKDESLVIIIGPYSYPNTAFSILSNDTLIKLLSSKTNLYLSTFPSTSTDTDPVAVNNIAAVNSLVKNVTKSGVGLLDYQTFYNSFVRYTDKWGGEQMCTWVRGQIDANIATSTMSPADLSSTTTTPSVTIATTNGTTTSNSPTATNEATITNATTTVTPTRSTNATTTANPTTTSNATATNSSDAPPVPKL